MKKNIRGIKTQRNSNKTFVLRIHYTADPSKDPMRDGKEWYKENLSLDPKTGKPDAGWLQEMEMDLSASKNALGYPQFINKMYPEGHLIDESILQEIFGVNLPKERIIRELTDVRTLVLDPAPDNNTGGLWGAFNRRKNILVIFEEYYNSESVNREHCEKIKALESKWGLKPDRRIIDPAAYAKEPTSGFSTGEEYERFFNTTFIRASKNRDIGFSKANEFLKDKTVLVFYSLIWFIWEIVKYRKNKKKDDHLMDCFRYLIMDTERKKRSKKSVRVSRY